MCFPVIFPHRRFADLIHQGGEVMQTGDEHGSVFASVQQRRVLAGTTEPDGSLEMYQRDAAPIKNSRQSFVGSTEVEPHAGRAQQHMPNLLDIAVLVDAKLLHLRLLITPEAVTVLDRAPV